MIKIFICSIFVFIGITACSQVVSACSCIPPKNPYKISKAVFFGELLEIIATDNRSPRVVKFKIEKYWKGKIEEIMSVKTTAVAPCGYNFGVGEKYLVYAGEENGQLETAPCRILVEEVAGDDLKKLKKGKVPKSKTSFLFDVPPNKSMDVSGKQRPFYEVAWFLSGCV